MSRTESEATSVHFELQNPRHSALKKYKILTVGGDKGMFFLLKYELVTCLFGNFPGALGHWLRKIFFPRLLKSAGRGIIWGRNITLRHPQKIEIGEGAAINDLAVLDAFGGPESGISIGGQSLISRNTVLNSKGGRIEIGDRTNIGMNCILFARDCQVSVGNDVLFSAFCYLMGGGDHSMERTDIPISLQGARCKGISVGDNVWLGAAVKIKDGCRLGRDSVIGTNSYVNTDIPEFSVAAGTPARVIRSRKGGDDR